MNVNANDLVDKLVGKLSTWLETLVAMLPNMGLAILLIILFLLLARIAKRLTDRLFSKISNNQSLETLFSTIAYYTVLAIGIFIVLGVLKLDKAVTSLLAGVGVVGIALGFAFQDIAANFVSGIILAFRRPFHIGNVVEVQDYMGIIARTNLRVTVLKSLNGQEIYIPNKDVLQNPITNYSILGKRRVVLGVGVSYGDDLEKVENLIRDTIGNLEGVIDHDKLIFDYEEFGDSSINFNIRFWINYPNQPNYLKMRNMAVKAIKKAFDDNDITIPFPIRTLDFGIKGGEKLTDLYPTGLASREN